VPAFRTRARQTKANVYAIPQPPHWIGECNPGPYRSEANCIDYSTNLMLIIVQLIICMGDNCVAIYQLVNDCFALHCIMNSNAHAISHIVVCIWWDVACTRCRNLHSRASCTGQICMTHYTFRLLAMLQSTAIRETFRRSTREPWSTSPAPTRSYIGRRCIARARPIRQRRRPGNGATMTGGTTVEGASRDTVARRQRARTSNCWEPNQTRDGSTVSWHFAPTVTACCM